MMNTKTVLFIHGLFQNPASWHHWKEYFECRGYTCYAPAYPYHEGDPATLRKHPDPGLGKLSFGEVLDAFVAFIDKLPEKPIIIGHSMGGLLVQKLIALNKAIGGVCIDTAPPKGIFSLEWSFLRANFPTINPLKGDTICLPSVNWFHYAFCNTMSMEATEYAYDQFVVPESRNIPRSSTGKAGYIDFAQPHKPLLFIAGAEDHIIPPTLNRKNFDAYKDKTSKREFKLFKGRGHYICGQENWQEVADFILEWITRH